MHITRELVPHDAVVHMPEPNHDDVRGVKMPLGINLFGIETAEKIFSLVWRVIKGGPLPGRLVASFIS
jgi:hypothetical protein